MGNILSRGSLKFHIQLLLSSGPWADFNSIKYPGVYCGDIPGPRWGEVLPSQSVVYNSDKIWAWHAMVESQTGDLREWLDTVKSDPRSHKWAFRPRRSLQSGETKIWDCEKTRSLAAGHKWTHTIIRKKRDFRKHHQYIWFMKFLVVMPL